MEELVLDPEVAGFRKPLCDVLPLILNRWSPRSFTAEPVGDDQLAACLEAARWAPSSNNEQPWRFLCARREEDLALFRSCLVEFNQAWANAAPVLIAVCAKKSFTRDGSPNACHAFDSGAAWMLFALEARRRGLYTHGMAGFDREKAAHALRVPEDFEVMAFVAMGNRGPKEALPERLQAREFPSGRNPVASFAFEGGFPESPR
jgi:nitroreductase